MAMRGRPTAPEKYRNSITKITYRLSIGIEKVLNLATNWRSITSVGSQFRPSVHRQTFQKRWNGARRRLTKVGLGANTVLVGFMKTALGPAGLQESRWVVPQVCRAGQSSCATQARHALFARLRRQARFDSGIHVGCTCWIIQPSRRPKLPSDFECRNGSRRYICSPDSRARVDAGACERTRAGRFGPH